MLNHSAFESALVQGLVILKPLPPGTHTLHFSGFGDVIVHLTVAE